MDNTGQHNNAVQHLVRTRQLSVRILLCMLLAFFLLHGLFGFVRRTFDFHAPQRAADRLPLDGSGIKVRP